MGRLNQVWILKTNHMYTNQQKVTIAKKNIYRIMKKVIKKILNVVPYFSRLQKQIYELGAFPAGHYYSPIPSRSDVLKELEKEHPSIELTDIDLQQSAQTGLVHEFTAFFNDFLHQIMADQLEAKLPLWDNKSGGSIYLQKIS